MDSSVAAGLAFGIAGLMLASVIIGAAREAMKNRQSAQPVSQPLPANQEEFDLVSVDEIAKLTQAEAAATKGEWSFDSYPGVRRPGKDHRLIETFSKALPDHGEADALFIALSRNLIRKLLDERLSLREKILDLTTKLKEAMSIDARVQYVKVNEDGSGELILEDRPARPGGTAGTAGQRSLHFDKAPEEVTALNRTLIWGGADAIMLGDVEIAKRQGYTGIVFCEREQFLDALRKYHTTL